MVQTATITTESATTCGGRFLDSSVATIARSIPFAGLTSMVPTGLPSPDRYVTANRFLHSMTAAAPAGKRIRLACAQMRPERRDIALPEFPQTTAWINVA